ncbi:MAG: DUF2142 domain-containing protein [Eubacteriales bacterium]|nr:DUF2142 domain-containing protein [Eubacteriales bacterium]
MERNRDKKQLFLGLVFMLALCFACVLTYKAQFREKLDRAIAFTMMSEHKPVGRVELSKESPLLSEVFLCKVPELKKLRIQCTGEDVDSGASLLMTVEDEETGKVYYQAEKMVTEVLGREDQMVSMRVKTGGDDTEDRMLRLTWELKNGGDTILTMKANQKQSMVQSFNGVEGDRTNVVYTMYYGNAGFLKYLYALLCGALLVFGGMCWYLLIWRQLTVEKFYLPAALVFGLILQGMITAFGVPDEAGHFDTAYKYSNAMLLVKDTGIPGTIYKRECDVEMGDLLANGLESNSYYHLLYHTLEKPENTELIPVNSVDSTNLVPGLVYFPAALGISLGRALGLSSMLMMQLGRILNLLAFVLLTYGAIRLAPAGKNLFGIFGILPISLQQGASFSYDAVVNGLLFLFFALCLYLGKKSSYKKRELTLLILLSAFLAVAKGGVYLPLLLFLFLGFSGRRRDRREKKKNQRLLAALLAGAALLLLLALALAKFMPVLQGFLLDTEGELGQDALYSVPYLLANPAKLVYMYWNTLLRWMDPVLRGLMGGMLSWLDIKISWLFVALLLICTLLLANVEGDRLEKNRKEGFLIAAACGLSVALIMLSMLVGYTKRSLDYIQGIQGRYLLPFAPALFSLGCCSMVLVKRQQTARIWMTVLTAEILLALQAAVMIG